MHRFIRLMVPATFFGWLVVCALVLACSMPRVFVLRGNAVPVRSESRWVGGPGVGGSIPWAAANKIITDINPPKFPARVFNVTRFGGLGNGVKDNTRAIARTIAACSAAGGGSVAFAPGTYLTGAIDLRSGVNLHISRGVTLLFSAESGEFPLRLTRNQGIDLMNFSPCIYAFNQADVALTGHGTLDGRLTRRWNRQMGRSWRRLEIMRDRGVPVSHRIFGIKHPLGTAMVEFYKCRKVLISGIHVINSQWWQLHPTLCNNVTIVGVHTNSTHGNSDGLDIDSCQNVLVSHCTFFAGDDCISLKSGRDPDKFRSAAPCRNIVIVNCRGAGPWGLISCGSEESQGVENVFAWNLQAVNHGRFRGVRYALYAKANSVRGGFVRNVHLGNISGRCTGALVHLTLVYGPKHGHNYPHFSGIHFRAIRSVRTPELLFLVGIPHDSIGPLTLTDCRLGGISQADRILDAPDIVFKNVKINGHIEKFP